MKRFGILLLAGVAFSLVFLSANFSHGKVYLVLIDGSPGTTWYLASGKISEILQKNIPDLSINVTTGGGASNLYSVDKKESDLGTTYAKTAYDAFEGKAPFKEKLKNIRGFLSLYGTIGHVVTLKKSNITKIEQLKGKRIAVGRRGFSAEVWAKNVLEFHGLTYDGIREAGGNINFSAYNEAMMMMADGHLDAIFVLGSMPTAFILELQATHEVSIINQSDSEIKEFLKKYPGYTSEIIPKGTYKGQTEDVRTTGDGTLLVIHQSVPEDLVYNMTKFILENYKEIGKVHVTVEKGFRPETATKYVNIPFHPGAMKYLKEKGLIK
jgi:TRAP transporter TAXI family solute receptor